MSYFMYSNSYYDDVLHFSTTEHPKSLPVPVPADLKFATRNWREWAIKKIVIDDAGKVETLERFFENFKSLEEIDGLEKLDTSEVKSMDAMFAGCEALKDVDLSVVDTSKVESMNNMFMLCKNLVYLDLSGNDLSKITSAQYAFSQCSKLKELVLPINARGFRSIQNTHHMFSDCRALTTVDMMAFSGEHLVDMSWMFAGTAFESLDMSKVIAPNVKSISNLFRGSVVNYAIDMSGVGGNNPMDCSECFRAVEFSNFVSPKINFDVADDVTEFFSCCAVGDVATFSLDLSGLNLAEKYHLPKHEYEYVDYKEVDDFSVPFAPMAIVYDPNKTKVTAKLILRSDEDAKFLKDYYDKSEYAEFFDGSWYNYKTAIVDITVK